MNMDTAGDTLILGTKAGLRIPSTECWNGTVGGPMTIYRHCAGQPVEMKVPIIPDDPKEGSLWDRKIGSFVTAIREGGKSPVPSSEIIINQAIIDGIVKSAELGKEIEIEIPDWKDAIHLSLSSRLYEYNEKKEIMELIDDIFSLRPSLNSEYEIIQVDSPFARVGKYGMWSYSDDVEKYRSKLQEKIAEEIKGIKEELEKKQKLLWDIL
jgi:hypothetical protein